MVNTEWVNVEQGCDFHLLVNHMTKFEVFPFDQTLSHLIVCLMISQNYIQNELDVAADTG